MSTRLNKLLAERGLGARRKCDALIESGAVRVNGEVVTEPGRQIEPGRDRVEVRGRPLPPRARMSYYVLHKPVGVISTLSDPEGRRTLREFLPSGARVFPVGRLDADTSGLLLLTNDGELAHHLMHPRYGVVKFYRVHADRVPSPAMLERLATGIEIEPGVVSAPAQVRVRDETPGDSVIEIAIKEGRYRQVRRMFEAAGLHVHRLHRWAYGPLRLGDLQRGMWRELSEEEVARLREASARPTARRGSIPHRPPGARRGEAPRPRDERERAPRRFRGAESGRASYGAPPREGGRAPRDARRGPREGFRPPRDRDERRGPPARGGERRGAFRREDRRGPPARREERSGSFRREDRRGPTRGEQRIGFAPREERGARTRGEQRGRPVPRYGDRPRSGGGRTPDSRPVRPERFGPRRGERRAPGDVRDVRAPRARERSAFDAPRAGREPRSGARRGTGAGGRDRDRARAPRAAARPAGAFDRFRVGRERGAEGRKWRAAGGGPRGEAGPRDRRERGRTERPARPAGGRRGGGKPPRAGGGRAGFGPPRGRRPR